jgi:hypothetical protein
LGGGVDASFDLPEDKNPIFRCEKKEKKEKKDKKEKTK